MYKKNIAEIKKFLSDNQNEIFDGMAKKIYKEIFDCAINDVDAEKKKKLYESLLRNNIFTHPVQEKLYELSTTRDLTKYSYRELCKLVGVKNNPQIIKHHMEQLYKKGVLRSDQMKSMVRLKK